MVRSFVALARAGSAPSQWTRRSIAVTGTTGGDAAFPDWESSHGLVSWENAPAPALVAKQLLERVLEREVSPRYARLFNNATPWGYGLATGAGYGLLIGLAPQAEGVVRDPLRGRGLGQRIRRVSAVRGLRADLEVRLRDASEGPRRSPARKAWPDRRECVQAMATPSEWRANGTRPRWLFRRWLSGTPSPTHQPASPPVGDRLARKEGRAGS